MKKVLICTDREEINIAREQAIYTFIYKIQEEVHRFTVNKVMNSKRSTLTHSSLEKINGIGPAKAKKILKALGSYTAVKNASEDDLRAIKGISAADASKIYQYFKTKG